MSFTTKNVDWMSARKELTRIREKVFVCEWRIPREVEFDQQDHSACHVLICNEQGEEVATGRITPAGEIGRIAVVSGCRKPEVYTQLISALLTIARAQGLESVTVQCELEGVSIYQQQGFHPVGSVFMDAGIPRQRMCCNIDHFNIPRVELTH
ncbi:GNAT family N-acetyltransferase [Lacimicrobium sp. SS2-24]|uniref:GNAT family N-acetyltransferase n=1 Tax=Lacimicrobium sp. SS2-24 TaxID=2005569 RepID=UPI000B4ADC75|nr:GNAT family N-acetyltransferase [Lacimicrobium sp. SS2-24]